MKPTRERAIAALNATLDRCDEAENGPPISEYERGMFDAMRTIRQTIERELNR